MDKDNNIEEYRMFVESASRNDSDMPIPNSTERHAKILYEYMLPSAKHFIHIFTGSFREVFYKELNNKFDSAHKKGVEICILTKKKIPENIKKIYPYIKFKIVNTSLVNHFMVIDNKIYRFEKEHPEDEKNVEAIANFNDSKRAKGLNNLFSQISTN